MLITSGSLYHGRGKNDRHPVDPEPGHYEVLVQRRGDSLDSTLRALVSIGVAVHTVNPELERVFSEELPQLRYADLAAADAPLFDEFRAMLTRSIRDPERAMWMVATTADTVIHRAVVERPEDLSNGSIAEELVTLLVHYLEHSTRR
jgi:Tetracyclin repressor-like, C-terminal domain